MVDEMTLALVTLMACTVLVPLLGAIASTMGLYVIVQERQALVYTLFGRVLGTIDEPGLHFPFMELGPQALLVWIMGRCMTVDLRLDQEYLRSNPVNSEEGAPMGVGVWYEFWVSNPADYLFKNNDPRGSMRANVSNAAVRVLSNLKLEDLLEDRHAMSRKVRGEVAPKSHEWGYLVGSVYIRKVHFRDPGMMRQIEAKVTNRLRQVTATIQQDGTNQVNLISSNAERLAAVEFARASAIRPEFVGNALQQISSADPDLASSLFEILEVQRLVTNNQAELIMLPQGAGQSGLATWLATAPSPSLGTGRQQAPDITTRSRSPRSEGGGETASP